MHDTRPAGPPPISPDAFRAAMLADVPEAYVANAPHIHVPAAPMMPTATSRSIDDMHDRIARLRDDVDHEAVFGVPGGDVPDDDAPQAEADSEPEVADALAMFRAPEPALRVRHRALGEDYAKPVPMAERAVGPMLKENVTIREPLSSFAAWFHHTAPATGWKRVEAVDADGATACCRCNRVTANGWPLMRLHHPKNDLDVLTCWPCGSTMRGKPVEDTNYPMMTGAVLATFRDERLWSTSADGAIRMHHVGPDCGAVVRITDRGYYSLSINTPDMLDCPQYVGTYETMGEVQLRAFEAIKFWEDKG